MRRTLLSIIFIASFCFQSSVSAQPFKLVRDINLGPDYDPDRPSDLTDVGGVLFFKIDKGPKAGIWKTDGTSGGTVAVAFISSGERVQSLVNVNGVLFYVVTTIYAYPSTTSLWKSDGNTGGSLLIHSWTGISVNYLTAVNNELYFTVANNWQPPAELWKSDGTSAGTIMLKTAS